MKQPSHLGVPASGRLHQFDETIVTRQRFARALQPAAARIICSDELRGSVTLELVASVHLCSEQVVDLAGFDGDSVGGISRLRVVTTDLTFVHYLSLDWLDCSGLLMSGGARDRFSMLNRAKNKLTAVEGQSNIHLRYRKGQREGLGTVVKLVGGNRERVLMSVDDEFPPIFDGGIVSYGFEQARPLMFAIEFVKTYRRANG